MTQGWLVRAGRDDEYEQLDLDEGMIAVGWNMVADLTACDTKEAVTKRVTAAYPGVSSQTIMGYAIQLHVLRNVMQAGDLVVLLRSKAPEVAIGKITDDYAYRPGRTKANHVRPVRWLNRSVRRSEIGAELLDPPALSVIYRIPKDAVVTRLAEIVGQKPSKGSTRAVELEVAAPAKTGAHTNLTSNLNYARNLTTAGSHLESLKVALFEVTDVYRAAWVQAVSAIDHWVHQEVYDRMLKLSEDHSIPRPEKYKRFGLSLGHLEQVQAGKTTKRQVLEGELRTQLGFRTYQQPKDIREAFGYVADVTNLWENVAKVLTERTEVTISGKGVQDRLSEIVKRRNKIAHEYDEDPETPPLKRPIDAAGTMQTIEWLDQLAEALLVVLDQE